MVALVRNAPRPERQFRCQATDLGEPSLHHRSIGPTTRAGTGTRPYRSTAAPRQGRLPVGALVRHTNASAWRPGSQHGTIGEERQRERFFTSFRMTGEEAWSSRSSSLCLIALSMIATVTASDATPSDYDVAPARCTIEPRTLEELERILVPRHPDFAHRTAGHRRSDRPRLRNRDGEPSPRSKPSSPVSTLATGCAPTPSTPMPISPPFSSLAISHRSQLHTQTTPTS